MIKRRSLQEEEENSADTLIQLDFVKSPLTVNPCMVSIIELEGRMQRTEIIKFVVVVFCQEFLWPSLSSRRG